MMRWLILLWALLLTPLRAEEIVLGLSQDQVAITANFDGSDILVFGAVKRDAPLPDGPAAQVIVTIEGPQMPVTVRRKELQAVIWANTDAVTVTAPSFYAVASSAPLKSSLNDIDDALHRVSINRAIQSAIVPDGVDDGSNFVNALVRLRQQDGLYQVLDRGVSIDDQTLFRSQVRLPANLTEGTYRVRILLTRGGSVVDTLETTIPVHKVGLERFLYRLAQDQAMLYGLLSLAIAIVAGWGASAFFRMLNR